MKISLFMLVILLCGVIPVFSQVLSISPQTSAPSSELFDIKLNLDPQGAVVQGLNIEIDFDPAIVSLVSISPGDWYLTAGYPHFFYDYTSPGCSAVHFSGSLLGGGSEAGDTVAIFHFQALAEGVTYLEFINLDVRDSENLPLESTHSTSDRIIIDSVIPNTTMDLGRVKSIYR
jgi:hypothetical protein